MTTEVPITLHVPDLYPVDGSLRGIANHMIENMIGTAETILDAESELPTILRVNNIVLDADPADNRSQTLQDKDGTIATLEDAQGVRPTVMLTEGLVTVDWDASDNFACVLSGGRESVFYMAHQKHGMEIDLLIINNGTNQIVSTWDPLIEWPSATAPTMPPAPPGGAALLLVTVNNIDGTLYGEYISYVATTPFVL